MASCALLNRLNVKAKLDHPRELMMTSANRGLLLYTVVGSARCSLRYAIVAAVGFVAKGP